MAKPASGTAINTGNSDATGLGAAWGLLEGTGLASADSVSGNAHPLTLASNYWATNGSGENIIRIGAGAANPLAITLPFDFAHADPWSIFFRGKMASASGQAGMVMGEQGTTNSFLWLDGSGGRFVFRDKNTNDLAATLTSSELTTIGNYMVVRDPSDSSVTLYRNGVQIQRSTSYVSGASKGGFVLNCIGNAYTGSALALVGDVEVAYVWTVAKGTGTVANLHADPYSLFSAPAPTQAVLLPRRLNRALLRT